jgi:hypothetical protein
MKYSDSVSGRYPYLVASWGPTRNDDRSPDLTRHDSTDSIWWRCTNSDCRFEWEQPLPDRIAGAGCPVCDAVAAHRASHTHRAQGEALVADLDAKILRGAAAVGPRYLGRQLGISHGAVSDLIYRARNGRRRPSLPRPAKEAA